jgi:5-methylcytosine-specific restriction enzyme subunit McrC
VTESKIPIQNIYFLLCYAWKHLDEAKRINVSASDYKQYIDLFAKVLKNGCAYILKRGLDKEYKIEKDDLSQIKGKIDFNLSIKNMTRKSQKLCCEYDDLSYDILHNQIITATIKRVISIKQLDGGIRAELIEIYKRMTQISDLSLNQNHFKKVHLHRNNLFYHFVLNIASMIYENIVLDEETGEYEFVDFIREERKMAIVFEHFVRNFYKEQLKQSGFDVKPEIIKWNISEADPFSLDYLPIMKTDISITSSSRKIIIDTKYYKECLQEHYDKKSIISSNLYQLLAYLENADSQSGLSSKCEGMLIYPTVQHELGLNYTIEDHKISIRTINLNQDWKKISADLLSFVN